MRFPVIALLLIIATPACAEWVKMWDTGDGVLYVDPETIRRDGDLRRASVLLEFAGAEHAAVRGFVCAR